MSETTGPLGPEEFEAVLDVMPLPLLVLDDEHILWANTAALEMYGAPSPDALVGRRVVDVVHPDCHEAATERRRAVAEGASGIEHPIKVLDIAGRVLQCQGTMLRVRAPGRSLAVVVSLGPATYL